MSKIIIHNNAEMLSDYSAVHMVETVISKGKVFNGSYCPSTLFCHRIIDYKVTYYNSKGKNAHVFEVVVKRPKLEQSKSLIVFDDVIA